MLFTRKIGKLLRGKATAPQVLIAALLGGLLGFVPGFFLPGDLGGGFLQSPGLILLLLFLVLVLNANLAVFGLVLLAAKAISLVTLPLAFAIGRVLLDGPAQGLFRALVDLPVVAWFGLEHYATTGGLVLGAVFGAVAGWLGWRGLRMFRGRMAELSEGSERWQQWSSRRSARLCSWLLLGGDKRGKQSWRELYESNQRGLPVRISGFVTVLVLGAGLWLLQSFLAGPAARNALQGTLETINGATADVGRVAIDAGAARVTIEGLAVADADRLERDTFRARALEIDLGTGDFLRKRFVIDSIVSAEASHGLARATPGERTRQEPPPPPPPPDGKSKTLDDYLKEAEVWKQRLQRVSHWLEKLSSPGQQAAETKEQRDARIEREKQDGITKVRAEHLLARAPALLIKSLVCEGVAVANAGEKYDLRATNLSTSPALSEPMALSLKGKSGRFDLGFRVAGGGAELALSILELAVDDVVGQLRVAGGAPLRGGTLDVRLQGRLGHDARTGFLVDLPLQVTLKNTTLALPGVQETQLASLTLPIGIRGPVANPRVTFDDKVFADALLAAGKKEVADQVRKRAGKLLEGKVPGAGDALGGVIEGSKTPEQLAEEAKRRAEEELKKKAEEELKKRGLQGLEGILGGKKKDG
jgi:uncharacterized protein (TIGR03546 family)